MEKSYHSTLVRQCKISINSKDLPEQALTTQHTKSKGRNQKMSDILKKLPKAPGTGSTPSPLNTSVDDLFDQDYSFNDLPDINDVETPAETPSQQSGSRTDIPYELLDTKEFESLVHAASRARALAAIYVEYAERNELPPIELLQSDDALSDAIQKTLVERAKEFFATSQSILEATLSNDENVDKDELLASDKVTTIEALYEINEGALRQKKA